jgi:hypothetical protein
MEWYRTTILCPKVILQELAHQATSLVLIDPIFLHISSFVVKQGVSIYDFPYHAHLQ